MDAIGYIFTGITLIFGVLYSILRNVIDLEILLKNSIKTSIQSAYKEYSLAIVAGSFSPDFETSLKMVTNINYCSNIDLIRVNWLSRIAKYSNYIICTMIVISLLSVVIGTSVDIETNKIIKIISMIVIPGIIFVAMLVLLAILGSYERQVKKLIDKYNNNEF